MTLKLFFWGMNWFDDNQNIFVLMILEKIVIYLLLLLRGSDFIDSSKTFNNIKMNNERIERRTNRDSKHNR